MNDINLAPHKMSFFRYSISQQIKESEVQSKSIYFIIFILINLFHW